MHGIEFYASDLSDAEWEILAPLPCPRQQVGHPQVFALRRFIEAVFYLLRTGYQWRVLPHDLLELIEDRYGRGATLITAGDVFCYLGDLRERLLSNFVACRPRLAAAHSKDLDPISDA